ncbi:hypothetical protein [Lactobacillus acidophilus]|uniref:hypothetical protein n=1 Tax=Lactobacillus acidophilus TaxID=1579 RepID=UPI0021A4A0F3|nr:hypothetical protein [Lactobacillus acidophilus]
MKIHLISGDVVSLNGYSADTFNFDPKHNIMFGEVDHVSLSGKEVISLSKLLQQAVYLLKDLGKLSEHGEA